MKRKDGMPKAKALRAKPVFSGGFADSGTAQECAFGQSDSNAYTVLSLFSGCGGMDLGFLGGFRWCGRAFSRTPFNVLRAYDFDPDCVETYRLNLGEATVADLSETSVSSLPPCDVLLGGFPCQDFSSSGTKLGTSTDRGQLYRVLVDYAARHRPRIVVGENVPLLAKLHGGVYLREIDRAFEEVGYRLTVWRIVCQEYGLPQSRTRLFLVACPANGPQPPDFSAPRTTMSIEAAICDLEQIVNEDVPNQSQYFVSDVASAGGGQGDHVNQRGKVAYTIRANARGRIQFHYSLPRRLTVRECARLQGFPDEFAFPYTTQRNLKLIGNAVPPPIAHLVAERIASFLDGSLTETKERQLSLAI